MRLLLAKALLDLSKADKALPVLDSLASDQSLTLRESAEVAILRNSAEFLLTRGLSPEQLAIGVAALTAAKKTEDPELVIRALFAYARAAMVSGAEADLMEARIQVGQLLTQDSTSPLPVAHTTLAYCDFHLLRLHKAVESLERAITLLQPSGNLAELAFALGGLGVSKHLLCHFSEASDNLLEALAIARRLGDDSRASRIAANLCGTETIRGNYAAAISFGTQSIDLATRNPNQPEMVAAFANLADAYLLVGQPERASECFESARAWTAARGDWQTGVEFMCESASRALITGNIKVALDQLGQIEQGSVGRESTIAHKGLMVRLRVLRAFYHDGPQAAAEVAAEAKEFFRSRVPLFYLDALAVAAWVEMLNGGCYSKQTELELGLFDQLGAVGKRAMLRVQGFLP
jgi:tetratricopeptide (TPR) repeat protein